MPRPLSAPPGRVVAVLLLLCSVLVEASWRVDVATARAACVFNTTENVRLTLTVTDPTGPTLSYCLRSLMGEVRAQGQLALSAGRGLLELLPPGPGYYEVTLSQGGGNWVTSFVVTDLDQNHYRPPADSLFGMHVQYVGAPEWNALKELRPLWVRCSWCGWLNWNPQENVFAFDDFRTFLSSCRQEGFLTVPTVGYPPGWQQVTPVDIAANPRFVGRAHTFPYRSNVAWHRAAQQFWTALGPYSDQVELWNEVDVGFGCLPHERYCEMLKVAGAWMQRLRPQARLATGASGSWSGAARANESNATWYFDLQNIHYPTTRTDADGRPEMEVGFEGPNPHTLDFQPLEAGNWWFPFNCCEGSCGSWGDSPDERRETAALMCKAFVQARLNGLRTMLWFQLTEGSSRGLVRYPYSGASYVVPKPCFAAYVTCRHLLERAIPLGNCSADPGQRRYLFVEPDGTLLLAAWQALPTPVPVRVALQGTRGKIISRDGSTQLVNGRFATFTTSRLDVRFVHGVSNDLAGLAIADAVRLDWATWRRIRDYLWQYTSARPIYTSSPVGNLGALFPQNAKGVEAALAAVSAAATSRTNVPALLAALDGLQQQYLAVAEALVTRLQAGFQPSLYKQFVRLTDLMWQVERMRQGVSLLAGSPPPIDPQALGSARLRLESLNAVVVDPTSVSHRPRVRAFVRNYLSYDLAQAEACGGGRLVSLLQTFLGFAERLYLAEPPVPDSVVITTDWPDDTYIVRGYRLSAPRTYPLQINVHNFSEKATAGVLRVCTNSSNVVPVPTQVAFEAPGGGSVVSSQVQLQVNSASPSGVVVWVEGTLTADGSPLRGGPYYVGVVPGS